MLSSSPGQRPIFRGKIGSANRYQNRQVISIVPWKPFHTARTLDAGGVQHEYARIARYHGKLHIAVGTATQRLNTDRKADTLRGKVHLSCRFRMGMPRLISRSKIMVERARCITHSTKLCFQCSDVKAALRTREKLVDTISILHLSYPCPKCSAEKKAQLVTRQHRKCFLPSRLLMRALGITPPPSPYFVAYLLPHSLAPSPPSPSPPPQPPPSSSTKEIDRTYSSPS